VPLSDRGRAKTGHVRDTLSSRTSIAVPLDPIIPSRAGGVKVIIALICLNGSRIPQRPCGKPPVRIRIAPCLDGGHVGGVICYAVCAIVPALHGKDAASLRRIQQVRSKQQPDEACFYSGAVNFVVRPSPAGVRISPRNSNATTKELRIANDYQTRAHGASAPAQRKPYTPEKPKGAKAMTIAAAIPYREEFWFALILRSTIRPD